LPLTTLTFLMNAVAVRAFMSKTQPHEVNNPNIDFTLNFFNLFDLDQTYELSESALEAAYLALQKKAHPDRFANNVKAQSLAVRYAAYINEAYETLQSPLKRAKYLLHLSGVEIDFNASTVSDKLFLIEQMELRETLAEIHDGHNPARDLEILIENVNAKVDENIKLFIKLWKQQTTQSLAEATTIVQKMHFLYKFLDQTQAVEERLLDL